MNLCIIPMYSGFSMTKGAGYKSVSEKAKLRWADPNFRAKMSKKLTEFWAVPANKEKMRTADAVAWEGNDSRRAALSSKLKAHKRTHEHSKHISEANKGKPNWAGGLTKETSAIMARKSAISKQHYIERIKRGDIKGLYPGQRYEVTEDYQVIRYCMCSPDCPAIVRTYGHKYAEKHSARSVEVKKKQSLKLTGLKRSLATRQKISAARIGKTPPNFKAYATYHGPNGQIKMRSTWEVDYARYLDLKGVEWEYESKTFHVGRGDWDGTSYTPDFYLPATRQFKEVKGWYSDKNRRKMARFKKLYPKVRLRMVFTKSIERVRILLAKTHR